ncbi:MAG: hypothetical protein LBN40_01030 [Oscillospiraceae bacterium]|jgi:magnesium-transporting ATPase (P-type)|nr:hypothetical protein [Oscillospiraceae bacterium]
MDYNKFLMKYGGMSKDEADDKLKNYGENLLFGEKHAAPPPALPDIVRAVMLAVSAALLFFAERFSAGITAAFLALAFIAAEFAKSFFYENKLAEIQNDTSVRYRSSRSGEEARLQRRELVEGDVLFLTQGEMIPADGVVLEEKALTVDETLLGFTSGAVHKFADFADSDEGYLFQGSLILSGAAIMRVSETGADTRLYRQAENNNNGDPEENDDDDKTSAFPAADMLFPKNKLLITGVPVGIAVVLGVLALLIGGVENLSASLTLLACAVCVGAAALPVSSISNVRLIYALSLGKLHSHGVFVKRAESVEIGAEIPVFLAKDTVMFTENRRNVTDCFTPERAVLSQIAKIAATGGERDAFTEAIHIFAPSDDGNFPSLRAYDGLKQNGFAGQAVDCNGGVLVCLRGTPEKLLPCCKGLSPDRLLEINDKRTSFAARGFSVHAVVVAAIYNEEAEDSTDENEEPITAEATAAEPPLQEDVLSLDYQFVGLLAFDLALKAGASADVKHFAASKVRVALITAEDVNTASVVCKKTGLQPRGTMDGPLVAGRHATDYKNTELYINTPSYLIPEITDGYSHEFVKTAAKATTAEEAALFSRADMLFCDSSGSGYAVEAADIVTTHNDCETVSRTLRTLAKTAYSGRLSVSVSLAAALSLLVISLVDFFSGSLSASYPPVFALIALLLSQWGGLFFAFELPGSTTKADDIRDFSPAFLLHTGLSAAALLLPAVVLIALTSVPPEATRSALLLCLTSGFISMCWCRLSEEKTALWVLRKSKANLSFPLLMSLSLVALTCGVVFIPVLNAAVGFAAPVWWLALASVAGGFVCGLWRDILKKAKRR